jgi:hypothetical protein
MTPGTPHRRTSVRPAVTSGQGLPTMQHCWPHTWDRRRESIRRLRELLERLTDGRQRERAPLGSDGATLRVLAMSLQHVRAGRLPRHHARRDRPPSPAPTASARTAHASP